MKSTPVRFLLRAGISFGLIAFLLSRLDWIAITRMIRGIHVYPLVAGTLLGVGGQFLMAERTRLVLGHWAVRLTHASACSVTWIGQFCNNFLPGGMGGDMVKFFRINRLYPEGKATTLVALVVDRVMALFALIALSTVALACGDRGLLQSLVTGLAFDSLRARLPSWWAALLLLFGTATFVSLLLWRFRRAIIERGSHHVQGLRAALSQGRRLDGRIGAAFVLAVLVHTLGVVAAFCFAHALAIPVGLVQMFLVWPVVIVTMMMPISVNGHGLREFILLYYFERWQLTSHLAGDAGVKESVVVFSLLVVLNDLLCNLPGGLLLLASPSPTTMTAPGSSSTVAAPQP